MVGERPIASSPNRRLPVGGIVRKEFLVGQSPFPADGDQATVDAWEKSLRPGTTIEETFYLAGLEDPESRQLIMDSLYASAIEGIIGGPATAEFLGNIQERRKANG